MNGGESGPGDARQRIEDLIEASSLGTPDAKAMRARVTDAEVRKVLDRVRQLDELARAQGVQPVVDPAELRIPDLSDEEAEAFREVFRRDEPDG